MTYDDPLADSLNEPFPEDELSVATLPEEHHYQPDIDDHSGPEHHHLSNLDHLSDLDHNHQSDLGHPGHPDFGHPDPGQSHHSDLDHHRLSETAHHDGDHGGSGYYSEAHEYMSEVHYVPIVPVDPADGEAWRFQTDEFGCVIGTERGVLESLGRDVSFGDLREEALSTGLYDPSEGIHAKDIGRLLEAHGLTVERGFDHNISDLVEALQKNIKVIVSLDSREIWHPIHGPGAAPLEQPDQAHVVWVTGIEVGDNGATRLILNDSGNPNGRLMPVDVSDFLNAWADFGNFAVFVHHT